MELRTPVCLLKLGPIVEPKSERYGAREKTQYAVWGAFFAIGGERCQGVTLRPAAFVVQKRHTLHTFLPYFPIVEPYNLRTPLIPLRMAPGANFAFVATEMIL